MENILLTLQQKYGDEILTHSFPKPYPENPKNIKAILLGCDPSNSHSANLPYVFAIKSGLKVFNNFVFSIENNLQQINLSLEQVYSQNLCRNYFDKETSKNPIWRSASKLWIPILKVDLEQFEPSIPVLLTSKLLYHVLLNQELKRIKAIELYNCQSDAQIPIRAKDNKLDRPLIPFYRHYKYQLKRDEWKVYRDKIKTLV